MTYAIYQFHMSREAADKVNAVGWGGDFGEFATEVEIQREVKFEGSEGFRPEMSEYYELVALVEARDLEDVFKIGNIGPDEAITRVADRMHSISVGDIVECHKTGVCFMVEPTGFSEVEFV